MPFSKGFIRQVVESTTLVDLISEHGITLKRAGTNYKGLCPFHEELIRVFINKGHPIDLETFTSSLLFEA